MVLVVLPKNAGDLSIGMVVQLIIIIVLWQDRLLMYQLIKRHLIVVTKLNSPMHTISHHQDRETAREHKLQPAMSLLTESIENTRFPQTITMLRVA